LGDIVSSAVIYIPCAFLFNPVGYEHDGASMKR
jgi:hypothetical protein